MALIQETHKIGKVDFVHTYSDNNKRIEQVETGRLYDNAWDLLSENHTYTETDIDIETDYEGVGEGETAE